MSRTWRVVLIVGVTAALAGLAQPAHAGGSTFSFNGRYVAPGQSVRGTATFSPNVGTGSGRVQDGPYDAYLVGGDESIDPARVLEAGVPLGPVGLGFLSPGQWQATLSFVVPVVRTGTYMVVLCNDPCRDTFVGDLVGAWIHVVPTVEEAKTRNLIRRATTRMDQRSAEAIQSLQRQVDELRTQASDARVASTGELATLSSKLDGITQQLERVRLAASRPQAGDAGGRPELWMAGWVVAAGVAIAWWLATRRRHAPRHTMDELPADHSSWRAPDEWDQELQPLPR